MSDSSGLYWHPDGTWTPIRYCDMCDVNPALDGEVVCGDPECQDRLDQRVEEDSNG